MVTRADTARLAGGGSGAGDRDSGYAIGALVAGVTADLLGLRGAVAVVAGLTAASGLVAARLLRETRAAP